MKFFYITVVLIASVFWSYAQEHIPAYYLSTDLVYDAESIPNIGYEQFFTQNSKIKSWRINLAYQVHYNDSFGIVASHGDRISCGVYQGPALKFAYTTYKKKHKKNWNNYIAYGLGMKYLWYDNITVKTGKRNNMQAYRIQSEKCIDAVPQIALGTKHSKGQFCADFYIGLQFPVKDRYKTIYYDQESATNINPNVPYKSSQFMVEPALLVGINIGIIKMKSPHQAIEQH